MCTILNYTHTWLLYGATLIHIFAETMRKTLDAISTARGCVVGEFSILWMISSPPSLTSSEQ